VSDLLNLSRTPFSFLPPFPLLLPNTSSFYPHQTRLSIIIDQHETKQHIDSNPQAVGVLLPRLVVESITTLFGLQSWHLCASLVSCIDYTDPKEIPAFPFHASRCGDIIAIASSTIALTSPITLGTAAFLTDTRLGYCFIDRAQRSPAVALLSLSLLNRTFGHWTFDPN
jgi:hypothetical protein